MRKRGRASGHCSGASEAHNRQRGCQSDGRNDRIRPRSRRAPVHTAVRIDLVAELPQGGFGLLQVSLRLLVGFRIALVLLVRSVILGLCSVGLAFGRRLLLLLVDRMVICGVLRCPGGLRLRLEPFPLFLELFQLGSRDRQLLLAVFQRHCFFLNFLRCIADPMLSNFHILRLVVLSLGFDQFLARPFFGGQLVTQRFVGGGPRSQLLGLQLPEPAAERALLVLEPASNFSGMR
mmetsp:Transcript_1662/g.3552  ORF Transcript_1662/g.3552 Transcript_1662/m.3552 type:complete len:234 (-) Transcript_1662:376-1077(-)